MDINAIRAELASKTSGNFGRTAQPVAASPAPPAPHAPVEDVMLDAPYVPQETQDEDMRADEIEAQETEADDVPLPPIMAAPAAKVRTQLKLPAKSGGIMSIFKKPVAWVRRHPRHPCVIIGVLDILDRTVPLDGLVTEISEGGALFRTASMYIFDRRRSPIALRFADREWRGEVVNVKAEGYGIRLDHNVTLDEIESVIARYGMPGAVTQ
jgi:hypothetical protein